MRQTEICVGLGGGSLLQVANRSRMQMMSYVIDTPDGKTIIIDGGYRCWEDGEHLLSMIRQRGGEVDLWLLTHGHDDHFGALLWILEQPEKPDVCIKRVCADLPPAEWFLQVENGTYYSAVCALLDSLSQHGIPLERVCTGQVIACGGISVEVLKEADYARCSNINDSSVVFRVQFPERAVLFLGDLAVSGGDWLQQTCSLDKLCCEMVQMAHHGQNGVSRTLYEALRPKICLYPTPDWLWDNDIGGGKGSGPFATLETRRWMQELGVEHSYPCAYGDFLFR